MDWGPWQFIGRFVLIRALLLLGLDIYIVEVGLAPLIVVIFVLVEFVAVMVKRVNSLVKTPTGYLQ